MKKLIYLFMALSTLLVATSCKKTGGNVNPLSSVDNLGQGALITLDNNINLNYNFASFATSSVGINVTQSPSGKDVDHIDVYASKALSYDPTTWKKIKTVAYTGAKTAITVTGAELATGLGVSTASFTPGSTVNFYNRIVTKDGATFDVSNTGNNSGSGLATGPNYHAAFVFTAYIVCPFSGPVAGTYKVIRDDWADWNPGDLVQVTDGPGTNVVNLSQVWPNAAFATVVKPLLVNVDSATGTATVPLVTFGAYPTATSAVGSGTGGVAGYVFSCTGYITLQMTVVYGTSNQGALTLILQKQ